MNKHFSVISEKAKAALVEAGGTVDESGNVQFPEGTIENRYSYGDIPRSTLVEEWKLPTGVTLEFDHDVFSRRLKKALVQ